MGQHEWQEWLDGAVAETCHWCGRADGPRHVFVFREHWPERVVSRVHHVRCAQCCDPTHNPRKPKGQPRPEPVPCCVCGQRLAPLSEAVHLTHVTAVPMELKDGTVACAPHMCHATRLYCARCGLLALHPPRALRALVDDLIARGAASAWAHPGPHPNFVQRRPPRKSSRARALHDAELERQMSIASHIAAPLTAQE